MKKNFLLVAVVLSLSSLQIRAAENSASTQKTQELLRDKKQRDAVIQSDPKAKKANDFATDLAGGDEESLEGIFSLAADVFPTLVAESGGDPEKMQKILADAQKDPASFAKKFSPEQQKKLKELSTKLESLKAKP